MNLSVTALAIADLAFRRVLDDDADPDILTPTDEALLAEDALSIGGADLDEMTMLRDELSTLISTAKVARSWLDGLIATELGEGYSYRQGERIYKFAPKRERFVANVEAFWEWLLAVPSDVSSVFPVGSFRITDVRAVAERRGENPRAVEDTFFDITEKDPTVSVKPIVKAAKWEQKLSDGEKGKYR